MNSGGIGLLVTLLVRANRQKQRLLAFGLNDHYRQIFELTRLDEAIGIYDDRGRGAGRGCRPEGGTSDDRRTDRDTARTPRTGRSPSRSCTSTDVPPGARNLVEGKQLARPDPGLREDVAEDLPRRLAGADVDADRGDPRVEGELPGVLAEGQPVLRAAHRHQARARSRCSRRRIAGGHEALDRRDGALRRRRVVHADDAAGAHVRRLDHVQRRTRRTARRSPRRRC